ncbi:MAG TPA: LysR family transcriptional regulator [Chloroflexota bacterium]|nr:LysR family transcriptional regulator [Chloroflexota bacterium]
MRLISQQIRVFDAVIRRKSFTRAARELKMTQPAITHHMHVLEDMCGVKLVERIGNIVVPTDAGVVLHRTSKELIGLEHDLEAVISGLREGVRGSLAVGTDTTGGMNILIRILQRFRPEFPDIDVHLSFGDTTEVIDKLADRTIDLGVVRGPIPPNRFAVEALCPDQVLVVVSSRHPLAGRTSLRLEDVADIPMILPGAGSTTRAYVVERYREAGLTPRIAMEFNSTEHTKKAVEANLGGGVISRWVIEHELRAGLLAALDVQGFPLVREYQLVRRTTAVGTPALARFLATVAETRPDLHFVD